MPRIGAYGMEIDFVLGGCHGMPILAVIASLVSLSSLANLGNCAIVRAWTL